MAHYSLTYLINGYGLMMDSQTFYATVFSEELLSREEQMQHAKGPSGDECIKNI